MDAQIRTDVTSAWLGAGIVNSDAVGQTLTDTIANGQTQSRSIRIVRQTGGNSITLVKLPDWTAFADAGWTASFTDVSSGLDITAQITGAAGWQTVINDGESKEILAQVTAPATLTAGATSALTIRVEADPTNETSALDVVKSTWTGIVAAQPDLSIRRLPRDGEALTDEEAALLGESVFNTDTTEIKPQQTLERVMTSGQTEISAIKIKNVSSAATSFAIKLASPGAGWTIKLFDAVDNGADITTATSSEEGWTTPVLAMGTSLELRLQATAGTGADDGKAIVRAQQGSLYDGVAASYGIQSIAKLQWSADGQNWADAVAGQKPLVQQHGTISFRAVKSKPDLPWPDEDEMDALPKWGSSGDGLTGEEVSLHFPMATSQQNVSVACGNEKAMAVRVRPDYDVTVSANRAFVMTLPGAADLTQTTLTALVTDEDDQPMAGIPVRFRVTDSAGNPVGEIGVAGAQDDEVLSDANGKATAVWMGTAQRGQYKIEASLNDEGALADDSDTIGLQATPPYALASAGAWQQDANGAWSRTAKVSTWFLGHKTSGISVQFSGKVSDSEGTLLTNWSIAVPFDAASGTTDANGIYTTIQRWNPVEAGALPQNYRVTVEPVVQ